jgi:Ca2+-transporting ATPase
MLQGSVLLLGVFALYAWALSLYPEAQARGGAFIALVMGNLGLALADSLASGGLFAPHRRVFWVIALTVAAILASIFAVPGLGRLFAVEAPDETLLGGALVVAMTATVVAALTRMYVGVRVPAHVKEA